MKNAILNKLRRKLSLFIIPLVTLTVLTSGILTTLATRKIQIQAANRHLAYKAEQLRDYINSEWAIIENLELADQAAYREAAKESFLSYAYSLLRTESEKIFVFDQAGHIIHELGGGFIAYREPASYKTTMHTLSPGWFHGTITGQARVGVVFDFPVFSWTIMASEREEAFFASLSSDLRSQTLILLVSVLLAGLVISLYVKLVTRPTEHLARTIENIAETHNFKHRARVEDDDEIGFLANRFNNMMSTIEVYQEHIERTRRAERDATEKAMQGEMETLSLLGRVSDFRDEKTGEHQDRISTLTHHFTRLLGLDRDEQDRITNASRLHDIGKIAIPDSILLKPAKLSEEEFTIIMTHTTMGHDLLKDSRNEVLREAAVIAWTHHEHWDGNGYPRKLVGTDIPLCGRITSIVDVFDALTSERPYKAAWTEDEALAYIQDKSGSQFDPTLVDLFVKNFESFMQPSGENARYDQ